MPAPTLFRYNIGLEKNVKNLIFYTSSDITKYLDSNFVILCIIFLKCALDMFWQIWRKKVKNIADKKFTADWKGLFAWARIFKRLWSPGIDSKASIPPVYVAWRAGTITLLLLGS
jgi:hypothetical protein